MGFRKASRSRAQLFRLVHQPLESGCEGCAFFAVSPFNETHARLGDLLAGFGLALKNYLYLESP